MREIGGYIELDRFHGEEYHKNVLALNSGRHCLEYLISAKKIKRIYIPYFLCSSIKNSCIKCDCEYEFYYINEHFEPIIENVDDEAWVYIVNYYGQISNENIALYKTKYKNIIVDNAQDFFKMPVPGVDTLYTCRKFFGVCDGGYLYTDTFLDYDIPMDLSYNRIHYILGRFETTASEFYAESVENNKSFSNEQVKLMSKLTKNLLKGIDYNFVKRRRTENFIALHTEFKNTNRLDLAVGEGAFMYPLYVKNGSKIRTALQKEKIYIPTLWADVFNICGKDQLEYNMAENILPLPCDQRYTTEDMDYIIEMVKKHLSY